MRRFLALLPAALTAGILFTAAVALAGDVMVHLGHNKVDPAEIKIAAGTTVVFHNLDAMPGGHSVKADDGSFESPGLEKDGQWSHTFNVKGTFKFKIVEHPEAQGTIIVE